MIVKSPRNVLILEFFIPAEKNLEKQKMKTADKKQG